MLRSITTFLVLITSLLTKSQTLTLLGNCVSGTDQHYYKSCTGVTSQGTGSGQVWNYVGLGTNQNYSKTNTWISTSSNFNIPGATVRVMNGLVLGSSFDFYGCLPTGFFFFGEGYANSGNNFSVFPITQARMVIPYPCQIGASSTNTYAAAIPSSTQTQTVFDSLTCDASGTLILPAGTFTDVLRVRTGTFEYSSSYTLHTVTYNWYSSSLKGSLLSLSDRTLTFVGTNPQLKSEAEYRVIPVNTTGISEEKNNFESLVLSYRNHKVYFPAELRDARIVAYNIDGKPVADKILNADDLELEIGTSGFYIIEITVDSRMRRIKVLISD